MLRIFDSVSFSTKEVLAITGTTRRALDHLIVAKRNLIEISIDHAMRRQGKPLRFSGSDIFKIAALFRLNELGVPQRVCQSIAAEVVTEAELSMLTKRARFCVIKTWPLESGSWTVSICNNDDELLEAGTPAAIMIDLCRLVQELFANIEAVLEERLAGGANK